MNDPLSKDYVNNYIASEFDHFNKIRSIRGKEAAMSAACLRVVVAKMWIIEACGPHAAYEMLQTAADKIIG